MNFQIGKRKLIVVCKNELFTNQLRKYVETNDDKNGEIIGTQDDSVDIIAWNEQVWIANKASGTLSDKVLLIGKVKGYEKLLPILDIKFNEFGIKYGWAGKQALIIADAKAISKEADYNCFFDELQKTAISEYYRENLKPQVDNQNGSSNAETEKAEEGNQEGGISQEGKMSAKKKFWSTFGYAALSLVDPVHGPLGFVSSLSLKNFKDKDKVEKQQYLYGITKLYENHLEEFLG